MLAFDLAFDLGAEGIECDVQLSADGQLVIIHDATVNRTTNGRGAVAELSLATMRALDAGQNPRQPQRIPTLDETLALVRRRRGLLNLELKADSDAGAVAVADAVAPVLNALAVDDPMRDTLLVSSFSLGAVARIRERSPWARAAALFGGRAWSDATMISSALDLGAIAIHPHPGIMNEKTALAAHDAGLRVNVWTANRPAAIRQLLAWGVDGVFTDFPERVIIARRLSGYAPDGATSRG